MNFHRRFGGHEPRSREPEFVDVSEEWIQLGSDWLSNLFPSKSRPEEEDRSAEEIPPRRVKH